jgi:hypothetical protein
MNKSLKATIIIGGAIAAVLFPQFVQADSAHTGVHIVDPTDAADAAKVNAGRLEVNARPVLASSFRSHQTFSSGTAYDYLTTLYSTSVKIAITSLTISNYAGGQNATVAIDAHQPSDGFSCTASSGGTSRGRIHYVAVKPYETLQISNPYPYLAPASSPTDSWCIRAHATTQNGSALISITMVGYFV